jgi:hypothetical protein
MPSKSLRRDLIDSSLLLMATRDIFSPPKNFEEYNLNLQKDLKLIDKLLEETHYLNDRPPVPKLGNIDLTWEFAQDPGPAHHQCFVNMPRASPLVFLTVLDLIEDHHVFKIDTNLGQTPVLYALSTGTHYYDESIKEEVTLGSQRTLNYMLYKLMATTRCYEILL